jgi:predicted DNA-binding protein (UPF0251 family)
MPRPRKRRIVCGLPENESFAPLNYTGENGTVVMSVDEYESIRLIDVEGLTQEECAEQMNVARTTVQGIYDNARKKLADVLVNSRCLVIEGGDYRLCDGAGRYCGRNCRRHGRNGEE